MIAETSVVDNMSLDDRFSILRQAGEGTYGTTWIAIDKIAHCKVAVKIIEKSGTSRFTFEKEVEYSKYLSKHQHIITTHEKAYESDTSYMMVQDYAPGGDLDQAIEPTVGLDVYKVRDMFGQIAEAVEFMHSNNLVHGDLKPGNVVLGDIEGSFVLLIDFGMTKRTGTHVDPQFYGTTAFAAPEILAAAEGSGYYFVDPASDLWSLGVLLFCMLTGDFPWTQAMTSDPFYAEFVQWQTGRVTPPMTWRAFSPHLLYLFSKLLALDPQDRCEIGEVHNYLYKPWFI